MSAKQAILDAMIRECKSCIHLATYLTPQSLEYRPSPKQRSTLELLRYLRVCGIATAVSVIDGNWDRYEEYEKKAETMTAAQFEPEMREQIRQLQQLFQEVSDSDWNTKTSKAPWGATLDMTHAMIELPLKFLTAYRMQLFLYAKTAKPELTTKENWGGADFVK